MQHPTKHVVRFPCGYSHHRISRYPNGEIALVLAHDDDEDDYSVATVALRDACHVGPAYVWLKGWSENAGVPQALEAAGLVRLTGETFAAGFARAELAEVLPPLGEDIKAFLDQNE